MTKYIRTVDCEIWAKELIDELNIDQNCLYVILPRPEIRSAKCLDKFYIPENGKLIAVNLDWSHHFAVLHKGRFYDENYPDGINEEEYRSITTNPRSLNVIEQSNQTWIRGSAKTTR